MQTNNTIGFCGVICSVVGIAVSCTKPGQETAPNEKVIKYKLSEVIHTSPADRDSTRLSYQDDKINEAGLVMEEIWDICDQPA